MAKRGRANGKYGRIRRSLRATVNQVIDRRNEQAAQEKVQLEAAIATLTEFLAYAHDARGENHKDLKPGAIAALGLLRELVEGTEFYFAD